MWIVSWNQFLMKKLLKSDICGSHKQYMGPTDVIKGQKSKKSRLLFMYSSRCPLLQLTKKKKKKFWKEKTQITKHNADFSAIQTSII